jgi:tetrahydromethanopterin S-methyltransferase subunit G|tara:strand:- start:72 stop:467 length:396 start_codon:yes stop_codon:yes gene_type:complete
VDIKRYCFSFVAVFAFIFLSDYLCHEFLLAEMYEKTRELWRAKDEHIMIFIWLEELGFAAVMAFIFTRHYEDKGVMEGLRYGLYIGLLLAALNFGTYGYMPIPLVLTFSWMAISIVNGLVAGLILALVYRE